MHVLKKKEIFHQDSGSGVSVIIGFHTIQERKKNRQAKMTTLSVHAVKRTGMWKNIYLESKLINKQ